MNFIKKKIPEISAKDIKLINVVQKYSMTSVPSIWSLIKSINYLYENKIKGDFVECGIWKGGNIILMQKLLNRFKNKNVDIYGYDTFEGLTRPDARDTPWHNRYNTIKVWEKKSQKNYNTWCYSGINEVKNNISTEVGLKNNIKLIKGKVEDTLLQKSNVPKKISLLRLDTDWYKSTKIELDVLYPLLSKGGILLIDDYGHWKGARKATDQYFKGRKVLMHRVDYTCRLIVK